MEKGAFRKDFYYRVITWGELDFSATPNQRRAASRKARLSNTATLPNRFDMPLNEAVSSFEKEYIEHLLKENQWHRSRVAELLGIDRRTLFRKMKAYGFFQFLAYPLPYTFVDVSLQKCRNPPRQNKTIDAAKESYTTEQG